MAVLLYIIAGPLLLVSVAVHLYVKFYLRPGEDSDIDDYYHEFEDSHPQLAWQRKWAQVSFTVAVIAALLLFIAVAL